MSRGFAARQPGDSFVDPTNREDLATFGGIIQIPDDAISAESYEDFVKIYSAWKKKTDRKANNRVYELNRLISVMRAAMVIHMNTERGDEFFVLFVKDLRKLEGKLTSIPPHVVTSDHGGYVLNRSSSLSERAGLKPSEVLLSSRALRPSEIAGLLDAARPTAGDEPVDQMQEYLTALVAKRGNNYRIKGGAKYESLHQKYLGEWAAPIALITGQFDPISQLVELEDSMLEGESIKRGKVIYNTSAAEALFDSQVTVKNMEIAISSKAHKGGGAAASLKGLHDTITTKAHKFDPKFWRAERNKRFKMVVETIMNSSAIDGVLELASSEGIIPNADINKIKTAINDGGEPTLAVKTKRLLASYAANQQHPNYNYGKHVLASVARALCDKLNDEDFTDVAKAVLNQSNVVQMMFVTSKSGEDLVIKQFRLIWPPRFDGNIHFYSGKNFSATEIKGRLGFKIGKGTVKDDEPDDSLQAASISKTEIAAQKKAAARAVGKIITPGERDRRDPKVKDVVALGRGKKAAKS
jgi:hypothetical protein